MRRAVSVSLSSEDDDDRPSKRHRTSLQLEKSHDIEKNVTASSESSTTMANAKKISISEWDEAEKNRRLKNS